MPRNAHSNRCSATYSMYRLITMHGKLLGSRELPMWNVLASGMLRHPKRNVKTTWVCSVKVRRGMTNQWHDRLDVRRFLWSSVKPPFLPSQLRHALLVCGLHAGGLAEGKRMRLHYSAAAMSGFMLAFHEHLKRFVLISVARLLWWLNWAIGEPFNHLKSPYIHEG